MSHPRPASCLIAAAAAFAALAASLALAEAPGGPASSAFRPDATMLQFPDVSKDTIVFVFGNDLYTVPRAGGVAQLLASPPGKESFPKFSPDGSQIAFVANYEGDSDIYLIPTEGGLAQRLTHHPARETISDWSPDGRIIYYANGANGLARQESVFLLPPTGGLPERLPMPYGTTASISPDSATVAYTPWTHDFRTWKRYRGGWATDIWLFNLRDNTARKVTDWEGSDSIPMWQGHSLYYLSDNGPEHRQNIWAFDTKSSDRKQVTDFKDFDIKWPSIGPGPNGQGEIVFQLGARLMLLDLRARKSNPIDISIPGDRPTLRNTDIDASKFIANRSLSPSAKRLALEARGDIWTLPATQGVTRNLTRTSGVAERSPLWSPDGKSIAYLSDQTGEYELFLMRADPAASDADQTPRQLTTDGHAFRFLKSWSPDSKRILFSDKSGTLFLHTLGGENHDGSAPGATVKIAQHAAGHQTPAVWSHDSSFIALLLEESNQHNAVWLYNVATAALTRATDSIFDFTDLAFDRKGDFLYAATNRNFEPTYSTIDLSWVYRDSEIILAFPLRKDVKNPLLPRSDTETGKAKDKDSDKKKDDPAKTGPLAGKWLGSYDILKPVPNQGIAFTLELIVADDGSISGTIAAGDQSHPLADITWNKDSAALAFTVEFDGRYSITGTIKDGRFDATWSSDSGMSGTLAASRSTNDTADAKAAKPDAKPLKIDLEAFAERAIRTTIKPGALASLAVNDKDELLYTRAPAPSADDDGPGPAGATLQIYNFIADSDDDRAEKKVLEGVRAFELSADGTSALVVTRAGMGVVKAAASQSIKSPVPTDAMTASVNPREEWRQMFNDSWRIFRDYFYQESMHGVNWTAVRDHYAPLVNDCAVRDDLTFLIDEMISELNVGHAYYRPGDQDRGPTKPVGMLAADFELVRDAHHSAYRIARLHHGAPWDDDARGPLSQPGVDAKVGDFLLAVNGVPVDTAKDPWAAFLGTADKTTSLTLSDKPFLDNSAREIITKPLPAESNLRFRAWIEANRAYADYKSGGKVGYIYVVNTQVPGQNDLVRQLYGQRDKAALIIDDRWNGGGQIPTRFIELLNRPATNYWAVRDGHDWTWPPDSAQGPKCMLINGLSASGGDMFPALFRQAGLGKLIGMRTWGGLVGISGNPALIDGTAPNVPTFGYYQTDGTWGIEGHGVDPDIQVIDDPAKMTPASQINGVADPQLDAAIEHMLAEIERNGYHKPNRPAPPDRSGMGIRPEDK